VGLKNLQFKMLSSFADAIGSSITS
jgi:hypothetical protein